MLLKEILQIKGTEVHAIGPSATCEDAVAELVRFNIGSLLVRDIPTELILGIITERDILRINAGQVSLDQIPVADAMSTELVTANADDNIIDAMRLMTEHHVRHLPVRQHGELMGIVSIGDIVKAHHDELEVENHHMRSYIQGEQ
jgi:CBS domain-containing protein